MDVKLYRVGQDESLSDAFEGSATTHDSKKGLRNVFKLLILDLAKKGSPPYFRIHSQIFVNKLHQIGSEVWKGGGPRFSPTHRLKKKI